MKYYVVLIVSLLLALTILPVVGSVGNNISLSYLDSSGYIYLDKLIYNISDAISINLTLLNTSEIGLSLLYKNEIYKYTDIRDSLIFIPKRTGNYTILTINRTNNKQIDNQTFIVQNLSNSVFLFTEKRRYYIGETVNINIISTKKQDYILSIESEKNIYKYLGVLEDSLRFTPKEIGDYSVKLEDSNKVLADYFFIVSPLEAEPEEFIREDTYYDNLTELKKQTYHIKSQESGYDYYFEINEDAEFDINLSERIESRKTILNKIFGTSPIQEITTYVENHSKDKNFNITIESLGNDVFRINIKNNPYIKEGIYTLVVEVKIKNEIFNETRIFNWGLNLTKLKKSVNITENATTNITEFNETLNITSEILKYLNYSFKLNETPHFEVDFTNKIKKQRTILDMGLKKSLLNEITTYVEGEEFNRNFNLSIKHLEFDKFLITIKQDENIKPDVYKLIVIAKSREQSIKEERLFNWGLDNITKILKRLDNKSRKDNKIRKETNSIMNKTVKLINLSDKLTIKINLNNDISVIKDEFFDFRAEVECNVDYCENVDVSLDPIEINKNHFKHFIKIINIFNKPLLSFVNALQQEQNSKGIISTIVGSKPFYTISKNPFTCYNMSFRDKCSVSWKINATGTVNSTYQFFVIANFSYSNYSNEKLKREFKSKRINITIKEKKINISPRQILTTNFTASQQVTNISLNLTKRVRLNITRIRKIRVRDVSERFVLKDYMNQTIKYFNLTFYKNKKLIKEILENESYDTEVALSNAKIKKILFKNLKILKNKSFNLGIDNIPVNKVNIKNKKIVNAYAIDPTQLNFSNAIVTVTASANELWKCKDWNFSEQMCYGIWQKVMNLTPGQEYNFTLSLHDPGYAETGLATINTKKSIYHPNETVEIIIVILDTLGHLVSGAEVNLTITAPDNKVYSYSTENNDIIQTQRGVYETKFAYANLEGNYSMFVTTIGNNVNNTMLSNFFVRKNYEFDIIRDTPVTTDPWQGSFSSSIRLVSFNNITIFNFSEVLPREFIITNTGGAVLNEINNKKILTWTNLVNNSIVSYSALPPLITPELYELSSFVIYDDKNFAKQNFYEVRPWYLAVDPTGFNVSIFVYDLKQNADYSDDTLNLSSSLTGLSANGTLYDFGNIGEILAGQTYLVEIKLQLDSDFAFDSDYRRETFIKSNYLFSLVDTSSKEYLISTSIVTNDGTRSEDIFVSNISNVNYTADANVGEVGRIAGSIDVFTGDKSQDAYWHNTSDRGTTWSNNLISAALGQEPKDLDFGDIDGDGDLDLVYALKKNPPNEVGWMSNDDGIGGTWTSTTVFNINNKDALAVSVGDLDGDGDMDIVSGDANNDLYWHDNTNGDGSTWTNNQISANIGNKPGKYHSLIVVDIDNDGDLDIVVGHEGNNVLFYENLNGDASSWATPVTIYSAGGKIGGIAAADIDNDGDVDILSTDQNQDIYWHENNGDGSSWINRVIDTGVGGNVNGIDAADMDNDGDVDVVVAIATNVIRLYSSNGGAIPTWTSTDIVANTGAQPFFVKIADIDVDGDPDVVYSMKSTTGEFRFVRNDGGGTWTEVTIYDPGNDGLSLALGDVDYAGPTNVIEFFTNYSENAEEGIEEFNGWDNLTSYQNYSFYFAFTLDSDWNISGDQDTLTFYLNNETYSNLYMTHKREFGALRVPLRIQWNWTITTLDLTPPIFYNNKTNNSNPYKYDIVQFNITINDTYGLSSYVFSWNNTGRWDNITNGTLSGTSQEVSVNQTITANASVSICYQWFANDTSDNWNNSEVYCFTTGNRVPNVINLTYPLNNSVIELSQVDFNFTVNDSDGSLVNCTLWENATGIWKANTTVLNPAQNTVNNITLTNLGDQTFAWNIQCYDNSGDADFYDSNLTVTIDTQAPTVSSLDNPPNGSTLTSTNVNFRFTASDGNPLANCSVWGNFSGIWQQNKTNSSPSNGGQTTINVDIPLGGYIWNIRCFDISGKSSFYSNNYTFEIKQPPQIINNNYNLTQHSIFRGETVIAYAQFDKVINFSWVEFDKETSGIYINQTLNPPYPDNWTNHTLVTNSNWFVGNHSVKIYANDSEGLLQSSLSYLNLEVRGWSLISEGSLNDSFMTTGQDVLIKCRVLENDTNNPIENYNVTFESDSSGLIGSDLTNSSGWASIVYSPTTEGTEVISCNITDRLSYNATSNNSFSDTLVISDTCTAAAYNFSTNSHPISWVGSYKVTMLGWETQPDTSAEVGKDPEDSATTTMYDGDFETDGDADKLKLKDKNSLDGQWLKIDTGLAPGQGVVGSIMMRVVATDWDGNNCAGKQNWKDFLNVKAYLYNTNTTIDTSKSVSYSISDVLLDEGCTSSPNNCEVDAVELNLTSLYSSAPSGQNFTVRVVSPSDYINAEIKEITEIYIQYQIDTQPPMNDVFLLNVSDGSNVTVGDHVKAYSNWTDNGEIVVSLITHNGTGTMTNYTAVFSNPWANYTLDTTDTTEFTKLGLINISAMYVNDSGGNWGKTTTSHYFYLWGTATVNDAILDPPNINIGNKTNMSCLITDESTDVVYGNYNVSFYMNGTYLGSNLTNSSGWAKREINGSSIGTFIVTCNITDDPNNYVLASDANARNKTLHVLDPGADTTKPVITDVSATPSTLSVGGITLISANVTDNINVSTVFVNVTAPSGTSYRYQMINVSQDIYQYNFSDTSETGIFTYYIWANDTASPSNTEQSSNYQFETVGVRIIIGIETENSSYKSRKNVNIKSYIIDDLGDQESGESEAKWNYTDYSSRTCSQTWGQSCAGTSAGDTFDGCGQNGKDRIVEEVTINATTVNYGDSINVTCDFEPKDGNDEFYIYYYNGLTWSQLASGSSPGNVPFSRSAVFTVDSYNYTQYVRCIIDQSGENDECADSGGKYDNDDAGFYVGGTDYNSSPITYTISGKNYTKLTDISLDIGISYYNATVSLAASSTNPDLEVAIYDGSGYSYSYTCNAYSQYGEIGTYQWNCSKRITNSSILQAWTNSSNRLIQIRGMYLDYLDGSYDRINWTGVYVKITTPSKIENYGVLNFSATLFMKVEYNNSGAWNTTAIIYNQSITVGVNNTLNISSLWNNNSWNTDNDLLGNYRAYAALLDSNGNVLQDENNVNLTDSFIFSLDYLKITVESPINNSVQDATNFWANFSLAYISYPSGGWCAYAIDGKTKQGNLINGNLTGNYNSSGGNYTNLTINDTSYWFVGSDESNVVINATAEIIFDTDPLEIKEDSVTNLSFSLIYCHSADSAPNTGCNGNPATGNAEPDQSVEIYNYSSHLWQPIGQLRTNDNGYEISDSWHPNGTMSDFINDSSGEIKVRYRIWYTNYALDVSYLVLDYATLTITSLTDMDNDTSTHFYNLTYPIKEGSHNITFYCNDTEGDISYTSVIFNATDQTPPSINLINPEDGGEDADGNVTFVYNVTDAVSGISNCTLEFMFVDNQTNTTVQEGVAQNFTIYNLADGGPYSWRVKCYDNSTNSNQGFSSYYTFIVGEDTDLPEITLGEPADGTNTSNNDVVFRYRVNDPTSAIANCSLIINNQTNQTDSNIIEEADYPFQYKNNFTVMDMANANYTWSINCTDSSNNANVGNSSTWRLTVQRDTDFPVINLITPEEGYADTDGNIIFYYNVTDTSSNIANCSLIINGVINQTVQNPPEDQTNSFPEVTGLTDGNYNWSVNCTDDSFDLNTNNSETRNFSVSIISSSKTVVSTDKVTYEHGTQLNHTIYITTNVTDAVDVAINASVISQVIFANTTLRWWDKSWTRRRPIFLNETQGVARKNISVELNITGLSGYINNCTKEIRIVSNWTGTNQLIPSVITRGDDSTYCIVNFFANISANAVNENNYFIYYNNSNAQAPTNTADFRNYTIRTCSDTWGSTGYCNGVGNDDTFDTCTADSGNNVIVDEVYLNITRAFYGDTIKVTCEFNANAATDDAKIYYYNGSHFTQIYLDLNVGQTGVFNRSATFTINSYSRVQYVRCILDKADDDAYCPTRDNRDIDDISFYVGAELYNNSRTGSVQVLINESTNDTGTDGTWTFNLSSSGLELGWYSVLSFSTPSSYLNSSNFTTFNIILDNTSPDVTLILPNDGNTSVVNNITFYYNVSDELSAISSCSLIINGVINQTNSSIIEGVTLNFTLTNLSNGDYTWTVNCTDDSPNNNIGTVTERTFTIAVDTTPPTVTLINPVNWYNDTNGNIDFSYQVTDDLTATADCDLYINGTLNQSHLDVNTDGSTQTFSDINFSDGNYRWYVNCTDDSLARNNNVSLTRNFTVINDSIGPVINLEFPDNGAQLTNENVTFRYNVTDSIAGIANCSLIINGTINQTNTTVTEGVSQNFTVYNLDGSYTWSINCTDNSENYNINASETRTLLIAPDTAAPIVYLEFPPTGIQLPAGNVTFKYNVSDFASGIANCSLIINGTINQTNTTVTEDISQNFTIEMLTEADYLWSVNCTDDSANFNTGNSSSWLLTIGTDQTPPDITLINPEQGYNDTDGTILFQYSVNDIASDVDNCSLIIDGVINQTNTTINEVITQNFTVTGFNTGNYSWSVNCTDAFSNTGNSSLRNFSVIIDNESPIITLITPTNNTEDTSSTAVFSYNVTDTLSGVSNCSLILNGDINQTNNTIIEGITLNFTVNGLIVGQYNWSVNCTDNSSNFNTGTSPIYNYTIISDNTGPDIYLENPNNNHIDTDGDIIFYYNVSDTLSDVINCSLVINGTINQSTNVSPVPEDSSQNFTVTGFTDGSYNWNVNCTDDSVANNEKSSEIRNFTVVVDNSGPIINLIDPANNTLDTDGNRIFSYNVSDTISNISSCSLVLNGVVNQTSTSIIQNTTLNFTVNGLVTNQYDWYVQCIDASENSNSNTSETRNLTVVLDLSPPQIYLETPLNNTQEVINNVTFKYNVTDTTGISNCSLIINNTINQTNSSISLDTSQNFTIIDMANGTYTWSVNCTDSSEGVFIGASETRIVIVGPDTDPPNVTLINPENNIQDPDGNIIFQYNVSDFASGIANCSLIFNGTINQTNTSIQENVIQNFTLNNVTIGNYTWQVNCTDNSPNANIGASEIRNITIGEDTTPPDITLINPTNNSIVNSDFVTFEYTASDYGTNVTNCSLLINDIINQSNSTISETSSNYFYLTMNDGNYNWSINCSDYYNNSKLTAKFNFTVFKPQQIYVDIVTNQTEYEQGKTALITSNVTNSSGSAFNADVYIDIIRGNTTIPWWNTNWTYRASVNVNSTNLTRRDELIEYPINFTYILINEIGVSGKTFDRNSIRVVEFINNKSIEVVSQFKNYSSYNNQTNAYGTLYWILNGTTPANTTRNYLIYFDVIENGVKTAPDYNKPTYTFTGSSKNVKYDGTITNADYVTISYQGESFSLRFYNGEDLSNQQNIDYGGAGSLYNITINNDRITNLYDSIIPIAIYNNYYLNANSTSTIESGPVITEIKIPGNINGSSSSKAEINYTIWFTGEEVMLRADLYVNFISANTDPQIIFNNLWFAYLFDNQSDWSSYVNNLNTSSFKHKHQFHAPSTADYKSGSSDWYSEYDSSKGSINLFIERFLLNGASSTEIVSSLDDRYWPPEGKTSESDGAGFNYNNDIDIAANDDYSLRVWMIFSDNTTYLRAIDLKNSVRNKINITRTKAQTFINRTINESGSDGLFLFNWSSSNQEVGNYTLTVIANKTLYLEGIDYYYFKITADITNPTIILGKPDNNTWYNTNNVTLYYNVSDLNTIANCSLIINQNINITNSTITNNRENNFTANLDQGNYDWTVNCSDAAGNIGSAVIEKRIYVDLSYPSINLSAPANNSVFNYTSIEFNFTALDNMDTNLTCNLTIDGVVNKTIEAGNGTLTNVTVNNLSQQAHTWNVVCADNASNINTSEIRLFTIDLGPPSVALNSPDDESFDGDGNVTFVYTPNDLSLENCSLIIDDKINQTNTSPNNAQQNSFNVNNIAQGLHTWTVNCTDSNGFTGTVTPYNLYIDFTEPSINLTKPDKGETLTSSTVQFNFTAFDNFDTSLLCNITINGTVNNTNPISATNGSNTNYNISGFTDGLFLWNTTCWDSANNVNTSLTRNFTIAEPPFIALGNPLNGTRTNIVNRTFFFTPTDNSGLIANCSIILNKELNITNSSIIEGIENNITVTNLGHNQYNWTVNCTDIKGNTGTNETEKILFIDLLGPSIDLNTPYEGQTFNTDDITFNFTATDQFNLNVTLNCNLTLDNSVNISNISLESGETNISLIENLNQGSHTWNVTCLDDFNNSNTSITVSFIVNAPDLTLNSTDIKFNDTNPDENETLLINATIYNIGGIPSNDFNVTFYDGNPGEGGAQINGKQSYTNLQPSEYVTLNVTWNITQGLHNIWVIIEYDGVELSKTNNNASNNISLLLSSINSPLNNTWTKNSTNNINFTLKDFLNNTLNYTLYLDGIFNQSGNSTDNVSKVIQLNLSEGSHYVVIEAIGNRVDIQGKQQNLTRAKNSSKIYIFVDQTNPNPLFETANNTWFSDPTPEIWFNITDNLDTLLNFTIYVNSTGSWIANVNGTAINATSTSTNLSSLQNGSYELILEALDNAGNIINSSSIIIYIDTVAPTPYILTQNNSNFSDTTPEIEFNITDNLDNTLNYTFFIDYTIQSTNGSAVRDILSFANLTSLTQGYHNITLQAMDSANNSRNSSTIVIFIDSIPPDITIDSPLQDDVKGFNIDILTTISDSGIGVLNATFQIVNDSGYILENGSLNAPDYDAIWNSRQDVDNSTDTYYVNLTVIANDTLGNTRNVTVRFIVDNKNPSINIVYPAGNDVNDNFNLDIRIQNDHLLASFYNITNSSGVLMDNNSNLSINQASFNWTDLINISNTTKYPEGIYNITVFANDTVGNNRTSYVYFRIDRTSPTITLNAPVDEFNTSNSSVVFNFTAIDNFDDILVCNITINGTVKDSNVNVNNGSWVNITIADINEGYQSWNVTCWDNAGNINTSISRQFTLDQTNPVTTLVLPANNTFNNTGNITFTYIPNDNLTTIVNCSLILDGSINQTNSTIIESQENNFTLYNLPEKTYNWTVNCTDTVGNVGTNTSFRILYIDKTAPNITITTANNSWFNDPSPEIFFNITDNFDTELNYTIYVNDSADITGFSTNGIETSNNISSQKNGSYEIIIEAYDNANNYRNSSSIIIYIDTVAPNITLNYPGNNSNITVNDINFNFTVIDNLDSGLKCNITLDGVVNKSNIESVSGDNTLQLIENLSTGLHNWSVTCIDNATNTITSDVYFFNVTPPDLVITAGNITFNDTNFEENKNFTIYANIFNIGDGEAENILIQFFNGDPDAAGTQLNGNRTINSLNSGENQTVAINASFGIGAFNIFVNVDRDNNIPEQNELNNKANKTVVISAYQIVYGNLTGNLIIESIANKSIFEWEVSNKTSGNIFVVDSDSSITWNNLTAIGKNVSNGNTTDDFDEIDSAMSMTNLSDSINLTYTVNSRPKNTTTFIVFSHILNNTPIVNSTNTSDFITGILWDSSDANSGEFNGTQDIIFVSNINMDKQGAYGIYDFEIKVPARLREYLTPNNDNSVTFYVELR
jgi:hypothetical protein